MANSGASNIDMENGQQNQLQSRNRDGGNSRYQRLDSNSQLLDNGDIPTRTGDHGSFEF